MDKPKVHKKRLKQANKAKKNPIKVVYISNPVSIKATASEFKGLVQKLTGQDSDIADLYKFVDRGPAAGEAAEANRGSSSTDDYPVAAAAAFRPGFGDKKLHGHQHQHQHHDPCKSMDDLLYMLDDAFDPQGLENFDPFMPTSPYCESLLSSRTSGGSTSRESV